MGMAIRVTMRAKVPNKRYLTLLDQTDFIMTKTPLLLSGYSYPSPKNKCLQKTQLIIACGKFQYISAAVCGYLKKVRVRHDCGYVSALLKIPLKELA
jgi:hypothetical protein